MLKIIHWKKLIVFFSFMICAKTFAQTGVKVTYYTGATQTYNVDISGKLYFSGDNLQIKTSSTAAATSIPVTIIKKIVFTSASLSTAEIGNNDAQLQLYPNPSSDFIKIKSPKTNKLALAIYSTAGQIVLKGNYMADENISVSKLPSGVYLVQVNGVTLKLIKK